AAIACAVRNRAGRRGFAPWPRLRERSRTGCAPAGTAWAVAARLWSGRGLRRRTRQADLHVGLAAQLAQEGLVFVLGLALEDDVARLVPLELARLVGLALVLELEDVPAELGLERLRHLAGAHLRDGLGHARAVGGAGKPAHLAAELG